jgi:hypothetical protein
MSNPERKTYQPSHLSAGDFPIAMDTGLIAAGQTLLRGSVLGQVTSSKEFVLCKTAAEDGSHPSHQTSPWRFGFGCRGGSHRYCAQRHYSG